MKCKISDRYSHQSQALDGNITLTTLAHSGTSGSHQRTHQPHTIPILQTRLGGHQQVSPSTVGSEYVGVYYTIHVYSDYHTRLTRGGTSAALPKRSRWLGHTVRPVGSEWHVITPPPVDITWVTSQLPLSLTLARSHTGTWAHADGHAGNTRVSRSVHTSQRNARLGCSECISPSDCGSAAD
jgi:hypothetical protein